MKPNVEIPGGEGCGRKGQDRFWKDLCLPSPDAARAVEVVHRRAYPEICTKCLNSGANSRVMPAGIRLLFLHKIFCMYRQTTVGRLLIYLDVVRFFFASSTMIYFTGLLHCH